MIRSVLAAALAGLPAAASAQVVAPTPSSAPSPAPTAAPDICSTGIGAIITRPTQTTSACVVKPNHVLIETGYQSQTVDVSGGSFTYQTVPSADVRAGTMLKNVELDLFPPSAIRSAGVTATSDVGASLKWQIHSTPWFAYGVNVSATAPTGSNPLANPNALGSANASTYTYNLNIQGSLGRTFGYGGTFSVNSLAVGSPSGPTRYSSVLPSLDVTDALPAAWTLFVEGYRQSHAEGPGTPARLWFDGGVTKVVGNAQFDLEYGVSNRIVPAPGAPGVQRHYVGAGLSYYF